MLKRSMHDGHVSVACGGGGWYVTVVQRHPMLPWRWDEVGNAYLRAVLVVVVVDGVIVFVKRRLLARTNKIVGTSSRTHPCTFQMFFGPVLPSLASSGVLPLLPWVWTA